MILRTLEEYLGEKSKVVAPMVMRYCTGLSKWKQLLPILTGNGVFIQSRAVLKKFQDPYVTSRFWRGAVYSLSPYHKQCEFCSNPCEKKNPSPECEGVMDTNLVAKKWRLEKEDLDFYKESLTDEEMKYYNQRFLIEVQEKLCKKVLKDNMKFIHNAIVFGSKGRGGKSNCGIRFIAQYQNFDIQDLVHDVAAYCWMMLCCKDWKTSEVELTKICRNAAKQHIQDIRAFYSTQSRMRIKECDEGGYEPTVQSLDAIESGDVITPAIDAPYNDIEDDDFVKNLRQQSTSQENKFITAVLGSGKELVEIETDFKSVYGHSMEEVSFSQMVSMVCKMWGVDLSVFQKLAFKISELIHC